MSINSLGRYVGLALAAALVANAPAAAAPADLIAAALADASRPADQVARDPQRKPAEVIAFAGLKPGDKVGDFMFANAYFTRIFSRAVGPQGHVYAYAPTEEILNCDPSETAGGIALAHDPAYANVTVSLGSANDFSAPEPLDLVWTSDNFHDLFDPFMGPAKMDRLLASIYGSLKPGGVFLVIDHVAEPGSGLRDTDTLHRIDPAAIKATVTKAGFQLVG